MSFDLVALRAAIDAQGQIVRIVVTQAGGSVPRGPGTAMLVWASGASGTIGGGALENEAILRARAMLAKGPRTMARTMPLGPDLGQCCGGTVSLVWEVFDSATLPTQLPFARPVTASGTMPDRLARRIASLPGIPAPIMIDGWLVEGPPHRGQPLWIWGAGHIGRALVAVMAPLSDWDIHWIDVAADRFPEFPPQATTVLPSAEPTVLVAHAPSDAHHIIVTYSHALDFALCDALLRRGFAGLGLIGSATKWARFRKRLQAAGHGWPDIDRIICPIGDPSLGKQPQAIALGVGTQLQRLITTADNRQRMDHGT